jgi:acetyl-CoA synthetase
VAAAPGSPAVHPPPVRAGALPDRGAEQRDAFWARARDQLEGLPGGAGLNIAHEAVDRHASGPRSQHVALRWLGRRGERRELSYSDLAVETSRFAHVLRSLGVGHGDRVFTLLGRVPSLYVAVLGALKNTNVVSPLFSSFGPEPIRQRLQLGDARVLVTTEALYRRRVAPVRDSLPGLRYVLLVHGGQAEGTLDLDALMAEADTTFEIPQTDAEDMALLHFTSGTTGTPKGAVHVHAAVIAHHATGAAALDLRQDDIYWCTADPGWVTGMSYGVVAPLSHGLTCVVDEGDFDARRWYRVLQDEQVTVWYTAPTAVRMLMKAGAQLPREHDLSRLRFVASVGEPLNPEALRWGQRVLGRSIHDNWWQTETGAIMIANVPGRELRPGSMGQPLPGTEVAVLAQGADGRARVTDGRVEIVHRAGEVGELALRAGWPSMFRGYLHEDERYAACFADGWYLSGDLARVDADGYVWFVGRADDVIKSAGHLIGPFEVESSLLEHPAVAEAGVIGKPDPVAGDVVKAFVALRPPYQPSEELRRELLGFARSRLGAAVAPREIDFTGDLPRTRSGKIMRRLLRARELGLPEGDLSTLEGQPP